ncbi:hypothetical protein Csa_011764 [Cucumis sativus]|uniref:Uncharacterized protein n=1 Tax=Cucumis sativus TaxID=3659 RepID=A0A0A0L2Z8_CUCSA|nr:hypothetical protein Csa_011764 [Cucumis sativus]
MLVVPKVSKGSKTSIYCGSWVMDYALSGSKTKNICRRVGRGWVNGSCAAGKRKCKVSIEYGFCEKLNHKAIPPEVAPKDWKWAVTARSITLLCSVSSSTSESSRFFPVSISHLRCPNLERSLRLYDRDFNRFSRLWLINTFPEHHAYHSWAAID